MHMYIVFASLDRAKLPINDIIRVTITNLISITTDTFTVFLRMTFQCSYAIVLSYLNAFIYTAITNLSTEYLMKCEVYTDLGGVKYLYHIFPPVRKIIHSLKLVDYLHVQADNSLYMYNYYFFFYNLFIFS